MAGCFACRFEAKELCTPISICYASTTPFSSPAPIRLHRIPLPLFCAGNKMVRTRGGKEHWVESPDAGDDGVQVKEEGETAAMVMVAPWQPPPPPRPPPREWRSSSISTSPCWTAPSAPCRSSLPSSSARRSTRRAARAPRTRPASARRAMARTSATRGRTASSWRSGCPAPTRRTAAGAPWCTAWWATTVWCARTRRAAARSPAAAFSALRSVVYCMVGDHLAEHHAWPVTDIAYGSVLEVQMQAVEQGRRLLAAEDGERLFLLVASERGVKVVRVSTAVDEEGPAASWYRYKMWMHAPVDTDTGHMDILMLDAKVESCAVPSEEAAMGAGGRYLPVPSDVPAPEGEGIVLRLRIDKQVKASRSPH